MKTINKFALVVALCTLYFVPICHAAKIEQIADGPSRYARPSANGRYVVFQSKARLTQEDNDQYWDIYLVDRKKQILKKISPTGRNEIYAGPVINSDGSIISYHVYPPHVVLGKPPRVSDIVLHQWKEDSYQVITQKKSGDQQDGESLYPSLSGDGRHLVFSSNATNLLNKNTNPFRSIYTLNVKRKSLRLISVNHKGEETNRPSQFPKISRDGNIIMFISGATNLDPQREETALSPRLYRRERKKKKPDHIEVPNKKLIGRFDMSTTGRWVVYVAMSPDQPMGLNETDLYLYDAKKKNTVNLTEDLFQGGSHSPTISGKGRFVGFVFKGYKDKKPGLVLLDRKRLNWQVLVKGNCENPVISADGKVIVYEQDWKIYLVQNPYLN